MQQVPLGHGGISGQVSASAGSVPVAQPRNGFFSIMATSPGDTIGTWLDGMQRGEAARLAEACGVSPSTIVKWKRRDHTPGPQYWEAIEIFFEQEPGTLALLAEDSQPASLTVIVDGLQAQLNRTQKELDGLRKFFGPRD